MASFVRVVVACACAAVVAGGAARPAGAQPPRLEVRPASLDLGTIEAGESAHGTLQVLSAGGLPLTVQRVAVASGAFSVSSQGPVTLAPGAVWSVTVTFAPASPGAHTDHVRFESNDPLAPVVLVPVSGTARQSGPGIPVTVTPPSLSLTPGSLGAELAVTGTSVTAPASGSVVALDARVRAEGYIFGSGNGPVTGAWLVDGVVWERFTANLWGGQPVRVVTQQHLPTLVTGRHQLVLEVLEPPGVRSPPVQYLVTPAAHHDFRLLTDPGFQRYLSTGGFPFWSWTPRAAAGTYEVAVDRRVVDRVSSLEWRLTDEVRRSLSAGTHEIEVRALVGAARFSPGPDAVALAAVQAHFTLLDGPDVLDVAVTDGRVTWSGPDEPGLFLVVVLDEAGTTRLRLVTRHGSALASDLIARAPGIAPVRIRVEAVNDLGEVVAASRIHALGR